jgi:hypothetical protein
VSAVALLDQQRLEHAVALDRLYECRRRIRNEWGLDQLSREHALAPCGRSRGEEIDVMGIRAHAIPRRQSFTRGRGCLSTLDSFKKRFGLLNSWTGQAFCRRLEVGHG